MAFSCYAPISHVASPLSSSFQSRVSLFGRPYNDQRERTEQPRNTKVLKLKGFRRRQNVLFSTFKDQSQYTEIKPVDSELLQDDPDPEEIIPVGLPSIHFEGSDGRPGFISFYNRAYKRDDEVISNVQRNQNSLLWFIGPAVLVASFILPSLYLRKVLLTIFEDSLLTDFLILFFTEALFYCGVAVFLLLIDRQRRTTGPDSAAETLAPHLGQRISSVATLVLSLIIPMVTMGLVWPWTGPAASATLAPYLVGIVVQFAFEQYARHHNSPSWPVIPIIFQVYRLHQLNRAAQLVTALSYTVRGAEMTTYNLAINSSLGTLLNVLQCLGVICIWSLSSFLMRFYHSTSRIT
ncbi:hypothetical protein F3Y22_tig00011079pilonHSYRG00120 [Hibiscus syriacus]|uniref:Transmembrane protein n=1 Tax=Hibiscus syriacus TaxID=106335 RepID=A0A6A3C564_HIBSY|nr:uncharacterized protein LOC120204575 isoform X1 [Hibiscus syriacus]KAE8723976.1 hypothetical protein F3Y22_tig00011079pilonHSYRG00120 [Hibiscus syriacus]